VLKNKVVFVIKYIDHVLHRKFVFYFLFFLTGTLRKHINIFFKLSLS